MSLKGIIYGVWNTFNSKLKFKIVEGTCGSTYLQKFPISKINF